MNATTTESTLERIATALEKIANELTLIRETQEASPLLQDIRDVLVERWTVELQPSDQEAARLRVQARMGWLDR